MPDQGSTDSMENSVAAYVLGAAEPDEAETIRAHLASCRRCQELERRLRRVAAVMSLSAEEEAPPPALRSRILAAAGSAAAPEHVAPEPRGFARSRPAARRHGVRLFAVVAALVAAVLALAGWSAYLTVQLGQLRQVPASHRMAPTAQTLGGASGDVVVLPGRRPGFVAFSHLPAPPPGKVYQLWLGTGSGRMQTGGVFRPDQDGTRLLLLDRDLSGLHVIEVTVEPGPGGSPAPTQPPVMRGSL